MFYYDVLYNSCYIGPRLGLTTNTQRQTTPFSSDLRVVYSADDSIYCISIFSSGASVYFRRNTRYGRHQQRDDDVPMFGENQQQVAGTGSRQAARRKTHTPYTHRDD